MESQPRATKWAVPALAGALLLLAGSITWATLRDRAPATADAGNETAEPTLDELRAAAAAAPEDGAAWARLGKALYDAELFPEAITALQNATRLRPNNSSLWALLGECHYYVGREPGMPAEAVAAFQAALRVNPAEPVARYWLAVKRDMDKDPEGAITDLLALLGDTPPGASWEADLRRTIVQIAQKAKIDVTARLAAVRQPTPDTAPPTATAALPGPTQQQIQDASRLSPSQQMEMGRGMVAGLEEKLRADPNNIPRWIMLMRSRMTLGEPAKASQALRDAIAANPGARAQLEAEARALGVPIQ